MKALSREIKDIDVIMLCGGKGKRLRGIVQDKPKCMAEIKGRPFLNILISYVAGFGFRRFILCIGYMGSFIEQHFQNEHKGIDIIFSKEDKPLGTAGAIKNAETIIKSPVFLTMNADSFCELDLQKFYIFHKEKEGLGAIALTKNIDTSSDYGEVSMDEAGLITGFYEKKCSHSNDKFVNAGIYMFDKRVISKIPFDKNFSVEHELFPQIIKDRLYGYKTDGIFIDIGTPDRYIKANQILGLGIIPGKAG